MSQFVARLVAMFSKWFSHGWYSLYWASLANSISVDDWAPYKQNLKKQPIDYFYFKTDVVQL